MSAQTNTQLVHEFFEAVVNEPRRLDDICSKDFTLVEPDLFPQPFTDMTSYKSFLSDNPLSGWSFTVSHAEPIGESVSIRYTAQGTWGGESVMLARKANLQFWDGRLQRYDGAPEPEAAPAVEAGR